MLLSSTTIEEVCCLFNMAQAIGVETVEWITEAKKWCGLLRRSHGWNWSGEDSLDSDRFPLLVGQLLISEPTLEPSNSNAERVQETSSEKPGGGNKCIWW